MYVCERRALACRRDQIMRTKMRFLSFAILSVLRCSSAVHDCAAPGYLSEDITQISGCALPYFTSDAAWSWIGVCCQKNSCDQAQRIAGHAEQGTKDRTRHQATLRKGRRQRQEFVRRISRSVQHGGHCQNRIFSHRILF